MDKVVTAGDPTKIFELYECLGKGAYSTVYRAKNLQTNKIVAIKKILFEGKVEEADVVKEVEILETCHDDNIVGYYGTYKEKEKSYWIAMELCGVGSVLSIYKVLKKGVTEDELAFIVYKVLCGLKYLHSHNRIHRDIKADNVLLTAEGHIKIADFGVSATVASHSEKRMTVIGTPFWMAPEVLMETGHDSKADLWSLGITAIEMVDGDAPHHQLPAVRAMMVIPQAPPPTLAKKEAFSAELNDFLSKCLIKEPEERWSADQLLAHPWIAGRGAKLNESVLAPRIKAYEAARPK